MFLLRFHSNHSSPDKPTVEDTAKVLGSIGVDRCAITDLDTMGGVIEASRAFPAHGIQPIAGMESEVPGKGDRLLFLVRSNHGFQWLNALNALGASIELEFFQDIPRPQPDDLWVICNLPGSRLRSLIDGGNDREAMALVRRYTDYFGRQSLKIALPPAVEPEDLDEQGRNLALGRERVPFVTLGCREDTGEPLTEDALHRAYVRVPGAVSEAERILEGCEFRWSLPANHLPEVHPGRGFRPESFLWEMCQRAIQEMGIKLTKKIEQRLYYEFHVWRTNNLLDVAAVIVQFSSKTALGIPIVRFGNPWLTSSYAGFLLGIHPVDVLALGLDPVGADSEEEHIGIDINLFVGRDDIPAAVQGFQEIFGHEYVAVRRRKATERASDHGESSLFGREEPESVEPKDLPITQIMVSRSRWPEVLPYAVSKEGFLETDLPPRVLRDLPLFRFHVRSNRLLALIAEAARTAAAKGKHIDRIVPGRESFVHLTGTDGDRGILSLALPGLSRRDNYKRLRTIARQEGVPQAGPEGFHTAVDRISRCLGTDVRASEGRFHKLSFAEKLLTLSWIAHTYPDVYYSALLSSEEMDEEHLHTAVVEAASRGANVLQPDVNRSEPKTSTGPEGLRLGLQSIRGIGPVISGEIIEKRGAGGYRSIEDLCRRTNHRLVNRAVLERLSAIGALDGIHPDRDEHPFYIDRIFKGGPVKEERSSTQVLLFEVKEGKPAKREIIEPDKSFILKPLSGFEEFLPLFEHEPVGRLGTGRMRNTACVVWFLEIFPAEPGIPRTVFITDGISTIAAALRDGIPEPPTQTACLVRGVAGGLVKRSLINRLLRRDRGPKRPDKPPSWLADLPFFYVLDLQPLRDVVTQTEPAPKISLKLDLKNKDVVRAVEECFRALDGRNSRFSEVSISTEGVPLPRHAKRLRKFHPLPASLTVGWLQGIEGVSKVEISGLKDGDAQAKESQQTGQ